MSEHEKPECIEPFTDEAWVRKDEAREQLKFARRTMNADQIVQVIQNEDDCVISVVTYLEYHALTSALIKLLFESPDPHVRNIAGMVFHSTQPKSAREALLTALFDPSEHVRNSAAHAYQFVARKQDGPIVLAALRLEQVEEIRGHLLVDIGEVQYQGAFPFLTELLRDPRWRMKAIIVLGQLKGPQVRAVLAHELDTETGDKGQWLRKMIELVDARAARDAFEAENDGEMPRPLTAEQMERILIEDPPEIPNYYQYFAIHATADEVKKVIRRRRQDDHIRYLLKTTVLDLIKDRDKRGY